MKKLIPVLLFSWFVGHIQAQTNILDFETPGTSTTFQYFGSPLDGSLTSVVANPNPSGVNTSSMVTEYIKPATCEVWAGCFSNPNPVSLVDLTANNMVSINVHMDHIGSVSLKLEGSTDGGDNWIVTVPNTTANAWETLVFDPTLPSIEAPFNPAAGHTYTRVVLFFDFGTGGTGVDVTSYFDDIVVQAAPLNVTTILDFEAPETSTGFQYFGSAQDGTFNQIIANPDASGINTSAMVSDYVKPAVAEVWAGAFSNPNPSTPVSFDNGGQVCIKVWMDHIGNLALKLEGGTAGQANWITTVSNTKTGEWEELCFDPTVPSIEAPFEPATGTYARIVLFFDFGTAGTGTDVTSYFDDIVVKSSGAPQAKTISFKVDMNQYAENFDQVYLSGTFNNWSGDANPLEDPDFDGIWEGSITVPNGLYEYKVTLDNWLAQEQFTGAEECTKKDPSGQFVNRLLAVSSNTELPKFCFNSCYACGEEVLIHFKLGMGGVTPNPDGVWLAGGGNFDVPGGKYEMSDNDGDGIYEITVPRLRNFSSHYTFANGPCADYSCKENLEGLECGDPNSFNDRFLPAVTENTEVATCFGTCATNAECTTASFTPSADPKVFTLRGNPPVNGVSQLDFSTDTREDKIVTLSDALGNVVYRWTVPAGQTEWSMQTQNLPSGMYQVTVTTGSRFFTRKLVR